MNQTKKVQFRGFWGDFQPNDFFLPLLKSVCPTTSWDVRYQGSIDLEIVSVFGRGQTWGRLARGVLSRTSSRIANSVLSDERLGLSPNPDARTSFWFSGENLRPPLSDWDLMFGFDATSKITNLEYLPLWWLEFPEIVGGSAADNASKRVGTRAGLSEACSPRKVEVLHRTKFACTFIANPEPMRMRTIKALQTIGNVDVFGPAGQGPVDDKAAIAREYRFILTLENDIYPDYITEKVIDGWKTGAVPIWNGIDTRAIFNPKATINTNTFESLDSLCQHIATVNSSPEAVKTIAEQPLLLRAPDTDSLKSNIHEKLKFNQSCSCHI